MHLRLQLPHTLCSLVHESAGGHVTSLVSLSSKPGSKPRLGPGAEALNHSRKLAVLLLGSGTLTPSTHEETTSQVGGSRHTVVKTLTNF